MDSKTEFFDSNIDKYNDNGDDDDGDDDDEDDETIDAINEKFRTCRENLLRHRQEFAKFEIERREISQTLSEIVQEVKSLRSDIDATDISNDDYNEHDSDDDEDDLDDDDDDDDHDDDDDDVVNNDEDNEDEDMDEMQADEDYENYFNNENHRKDIKINQQKPIPFNDQIESEPLKSSKKFNIGQLEPNKLSCILS